MIVLIYLLGVPVLLFLLLLFILLFSPLQYRLKFSLMGDPAARFSAALLPLCSLVCSFQDYRLKMVARVFGIRVKLPGGQAGPEKSREEEKKTAGKKGLPFSLKLVTRENFRHFIELFRDMYHIFRPRELRITGKLGFPEPYHTAMLFAAINYFPENLRGSLYLEPVWDEYLEVEGVAAGSILLFLVLLRAVTFLLSRKTRQIWRQIKAQKKSRRHETRKVKPV